MSNRRKEHLDALERRLTGPRRIALFGHRAVGKTTLLAMFYREASTGRVPGLRLAATRPSSAEYLAEKIGQIEAGDPPAGTLAETELHLRLYRGPARFDLIVKDYQGEHVSLGSDAPIREFFADCDAVLLCLDPEGSAAPSERRRRQQEIEELLERYIETSDDGTAGRPVALLVTKYDRVLARGGPAPQDVERLVESRYGMTRHALAHHAPRGAIFAVSAYGRGALDDRPPAELHPLGLEGPLGWLAEQLEAGDREQLEWLWDLAPDDLPRLARCVKAYERRYPQSDHAITFRRRLNALRRKHLRRRLASAVVLGGLLVGGLALYDVWGYRNALAFERGDNPAPAVQQRWHEFLTWHPSQVLFWPGQARQARHKLSEWKVKAAAHRVEVGTAGPDLPAELTRLKEEAPPELVADIRQVEQARQKQQHDERWKTLQMAEVLAGDRPEAQIADLRAFLQEYPETPHKAEVSRMLASLDTQVHERRDRLEHQDIEALARAAELPDADLPLLIEQAHDFLKSHPESRWRGDVDSLIRDLAHRIDEADIEKARQYSRQYPNANFATRIKKYQDYLDAHARTGGAFISEAMEAITQIERARDTYTYRQAYDHYVAHPNDVATVAGRLRSYLTANPDGRFAKAARDYLAWWDSVTTPSEYHVTLKRGAVEEEVGKYLAGGAPNLGVELWVAGNKYGPSPAVPNSHKPNWNYTFRPIKWKYGDPVIIRIRDFDWSTSGTPIFRLNSPKDDPLAMRYLSGVIKPSKGGQTFLEFSSDFQMPTLPKPE